MLVELVELAPVRFEGFKIYYVSTDIIKYSPENYKGHAYL
jgi:hypothetical protein